MQLSTACAALSIATSVQAIDVLALRPTRFLRQFLIEVSTCRAFSFLALFSDFVFEAAI
jgi:hypothetical protein